MKTFFIICSLIIGLISAAIPIPGTDVWYSQFIAVMGIGFLCLAILISRMSLSIGIFFAYLVFSTIFIAKTDLISILCLIQTGLCLLVAYLVSKLNLRYRDIIIKTLFYLLLFQVGWGILQYFNLDPVFKMVGSDNKLCDTVGFSGSHNQYGLFLSALSPLVFNNLILCALVLTAIIISKTYSAFIAMAAAFVYFNRKTSKVFYLSAIAFICLSFVFLYFNPKNLDMKLKERIGIWKLSIHQVMNEKAVLDLNSQVKEIIPCNKWFGFGFGRFFGISPYTQNKVIASNSKGTHRYEHAHNDYVELFFDTGIIGISLFIFIIIGFLVNLSKFDNFRIRLIGSCILAFAVCAMSIYTVHTACNGFLFCVLLGLIYAEFNYKNIKEEIA
jgi:O-antigen ligase